MERFMKGLSGQSITAMRGERLSMEQIQSVCPRVFAETHSRVTERYRRIDTGGMFQVLNDNGFYPVEAAQAKARTFDDGTQSNRSRHMLRFAHEDVVLDGDSRFEVIMVNSHDGRSSFRLIPGLFRFVCANGLMVGTQFEALRVHHVPGERYDGLLTAMNTVLQSSSAIAETADRWRKTGLSPELVDYFTRNAYRLRWGNYQPPVPSTRPEDLPLMRPDMLLETRRGEDKGGDLWSMFNVVQENLIAGDQEGQRGARRTTPIVAMKARERINRMLWDIAENVARVSAGDASFDERGLLVENA